MDAVLKEQINTQYKMHDSQRKAVTRRHENDMKYKVNTFFTDTCNTNETEHFHSYAFISLSKFIEENNSKVESWHSSIPADIHSSMDPSTS